MYPVASMFRHTLLAVAAVALTACASGPEIRHDTNPSANFAGYKTFGYFSPLATDTAGYESVFTARLKAATRREMESKGYTYSESDPDLLLNFFANIEDRQEIRSTPTSAGMSTGYYGYRRGFYTGFNTTEIETVNYKAGTLTIDLVDPRQKVLVWQATAEGRVSSKARKDPGPAIDAIVTQLMAPLPAKSGM